MPYKKINIEPLLALLQSESDIEHPLLEPFNNISPHFEEANMRLLTGCLKAAREDINAYIRFFNPQNTFYTHPGLWIRQRTREEASRLSKLPSCLFIPVNFKRQVLAFERAKRRLAPSAPTLPRALSDFTMDFWGGAVKSAMELPLRTRAFYHLSPKVFSWLLSLSAAEVKTFSCMDGWVFNLTLRPDLVTINFQNGPLPELKALLIHESAQQRIKFPEELITANIKEGEK